MLAFLQSSFLPQVPVKHHMPVCSPFTLNTPTHVWEHPYQRRWRPGTPRDWRVPWGMDSPAQLCSVLPQAESVFVFLAAHIHITSGPVWLLQTGSGICHLHTPCGLCTDGKKSGSPQTFTFSIFLSLVIKSGWSWKAASQKQLVIKVWAEGNWGTS